MSTALSEVINEAVRVECDARVGWVVLTRPNQINAINDAIRQGTAGADPAAARSRDPRDCDSW